MEEIKKNLHQKIVVIYPLSLRGR